LCSIRSKHVENAAIINIKERQVCATTFGFNVPPENALNLIYAFCKNLLKVRRGGLWFKDKHYKCVHVDEHSIYLQNLIVVKTKTFILVATYKAGMYPSVCMEAVEKLAGWTQNHCTSTALPREPPFSCASDMIPAHACNSSSDGSVRA
ncbi:LOW QUALITY PROTEIN: profilin-4, partial [Guaruba guarouba]